ncbi:unnamed protein product [Acanthoscelides obtectus]|uniref:Uncharacterized protein n=1 Tax=Acanthoscelides obtectus TaxID=200917 RepID=A0A9P0M9Q9_ACAOB|nr:unnamed protein product [Acanthoscelides obtectus]CAK1662593.1 hypothetical protein AOBTE_LOCUS23230 [Acanthoscelides obtectus]
MSLGDPDFELVNK